MEISEIDQRIDQFMAHKHAEGLRKKTLDDWRYRIRRITRECGITSFASLDEAKIVDWFSDIAKIDPLTGKPKLAANTRRLNYRYLYAFFEWAIMQGLIASNPCMKAPRPKNFKRDRRKFRRAMTAEELERLVFVAKLRPLAEYGKTRMIGSKHKDYWTSNPISLTNIEGLAEMARRIRHASVVRRMELDGIKWALAYRTLALVGLRWNELRTLKAGQFDFGDSPEIRLNADDTKNGNADRLPLQKDLAVDLEKWIESKKLKAGDPLFVLPTAGVRRFYRDCNAAGIAIVDQMGRVVDIHCLRYSFGTMLALANVHPRVAMKLMRHSKIDLTMNIYTDAENLDTHGAIADLPAVGMIESQSAVTPSGSVPAATQPTLSMQDLMILAILKKADPGKLQAALLGLV